MTENDLVYLLKRAAQERSRTNDAQCVYARQAHDTMAKAYEHRLQDATPSATERLRPN